MFRLITQVGFLCCFVIIFHFNSLDHGLGGERVQLFYIGQSFFCACKCNKASSSASVESGPLYGFVPSLYNLPQILIVSGTCRVQVGLFLFLVFIFLRPLPRVLQSSLTLCLPTWLFGVWHRTDCFLGGWFYHHTNHYISLWMSWYALKTLVVCKCLW